LKLTDGALQAEEQDAGWAKEQVLEKEPIHIMPHPQEIFTDRSTK